MIQKIRHTHVSICYIFIDEIVNSYKNYYFKLLCSKIACNIKSNNPHNIVSFLLLFGEY